MLHSNEYKATVIGSIGSNIEYGNTAFINGRDEYYSKVSNNVEKSKIQVEMLKSAVLNFCCTNTMKKMHQGD